MVVGGGEEAEDHLLGYEIALSQNTFGKQVTDEAANRLVSFVNKSSFN